VIADGWVRTALSLAVMFAAGLAVIVNLWLVTYRPDGLPSLRLYRAGICVVYLITFIGSLVDPRAAWPVAIRWTITGVAFLTVYILPSMLPRPVVGTHPPEGSDRDRS